MGKDSRSKQLTNVGQTASSAYQNLVNKPTDLEKEFTPQAQTMWNNYQNAVGQNTADYGNIMGGYHSFAENLGGPTKFSYRNVGAERPAELGESYGYLREAAPGYREFASTGGYSPTDIQELRARGVSPIRAAYGNTMMELNRARALGGAGGSPNYIAALSRAQRELPEQMSTAMTGVNAGLADAIRQGKLSGLAGLTGIGSTMGGLSSEEANRMLQAAIANQGADITTQGMGEQSLQALRANQLAALSGQTSLYGTTPAMSAMFGNQALNAYQTRAGMEQARNQFGLGLIGAQTNAYSGTTPQVPWWQTALNAAGTAAPYISMATGGGNTNTGMGAAYGVPPGIAANPSSSGGGTPWWKKALGVVGTVAPYVAMAMSSREFKEDIRPVKNTSKFAKYLKELPLYTWKYKGDNVRHFGPIAEEFQEKFGIGDGRTMHLADVMGVMLAAAKEA